MKISCPSPSCDQVLTGSKSQIGVRTACRACGHSFIWSDCFHAGDSFVIYDLETTGLSPDADEIIQIAAVRFQAGGLCLEDNFFSYARPRRAISSFITGYTGIRNEDVRHAPQPEEVLGQFGLWARDSTLIAHNGLRFDSKFLTATSQRHNRPSREVQCIDSIHISKMLFGSTRGTGHSLDHLKSRLGLRDTAMRRHDARGDVDLLGRAVEEMSRRLELDNAFNGVRRHSSLLPLGA